MQVSMVAADLVKWIAWGRVVVREIHGWNGQGSDVYIQLHQVPPLANGTLTASAVPAYKSLLAQAGNGFMYNFGPQGIELSELLIALSTTEVNYTAVSAAGGLDLTIDFDSQSACDGTEVVVGDLTTGQNTLQVWAESAGPKRLLRVDVKDNQNTNQLVGIVYAVDTVAVTSLPTAFFSCNKNTTTTVYFGDANCGFSPDQQDANYTQHRGCTINISALTSGYWAAGSLYGGTSPNIRAIYK